MSRALVIKNADFSTNKITTVEFNDVPCTGVAFASSSITLTALGAASISYSVTPFNTTDNVILESSDSSILIVEGTTVTVVGIGECTLTLKCGAYSAVCNVTVDIYENPVFAIGTTTVYNTSATGFDTDVIGYCKGDSKYNVMCFGDYSDDYFLNKITYTNNSYGFNPGEITAIKIPNNTAKIHIYCKNTSTTNATIRFLDADQSETYGSYTCIPIVSSENISPKISSGVRYVEEDIEVPDGCTGYQLQIQLASAIDTTTVTDESTLTALMEEINEFEIHYLPASVGE